MNIYFVCTGNTCRSPMAAAILKAKNIANIDVRSAGIYALEGGGISENANRVLEKADIAHNHVSHQVHQDDIEWADLILTMTVSHKEMLLQQFEQASGKTYTLKEYVTPYTAFDVSDPYGGDLYTYQHTFVELQQLIEQLIEKVGAS